MGIKVTEMTEATQVNNNDLFMIVQNGENKKITKETLQDSIVDAELEERVDTLEDNVEDLQDEVETLQEENLYLNNLVEQAFDKKEVEGEELSIDDTINAKMEVNLFGNTTQETTTGKNKYEGSQDFSGTWVNSSSWDTDTNTYNGLVVKKRAVAWDGLFKEINVEANKTYTFSFYAKADALRECAIYVGGGTATISDFQYKNIKPTTNWTRYSVTFTPSTSGTVKARVENTTSVSNNYTYICGYQLEEGSTASSYEKYTGKIPAPNPDYPQEVHTVTGDNTIVVSNKNKFIGFVEHQEQTYQVNLGNIELCKIGDYQDYFYKSNNKWYKHSEIGKVVLDGNITGSIRTDIQNENTICFKTDAGITNILANSKPISNYFTAINDTSDVEHIRYIGTSGYRFQLFLSKQKATTANEVITWLSTHNTEVYYVKETATDIEITDTTLIEQLEALKTAMSYAGQTNISQINNDAPFILQVTALASYNSRILALENAILNANRSTQTEQLRKSNEVIEEPKEEVVNDNKDEPKEEIKEER